MILDNLTLKYVLLLLCDIVLLFLKYFSIVWLLLDIVLLIYFIFIIIYV